MVESVHSIVWYSPSSGAPDVRLHRQTICAYLSIDRSAERSVVLNPSLSLSVRIYVLSSAARLRVVIAFSD